MCLNNLTVPACLVESSGDLIQLDLTISADGKIMTTKADDDSVKDIDMYGTMVLPCFIDMHTHLDKGQICARAPNPDGLVPSQQWKEIGWHISRWRICFRRAEFFLRTVWAHGTKMIRTHVDSFPPQDEISLPVFCDSRHIQHLCHGSRRSLWFVVKQGRAGFK